MKTATMNLTNTINPWLLVVGVPMLLHGGTTPAAGATMESRSKIVSVHDLDLQSPGDRREFDRRIDRAARSVCFAAGDRFSHQFRKCVAEAKRNAEPQKAD